MSGDIFNLPLVYQSRLGPFAQNCLIKGVNLTMKILLGLVSVSTIFRPGLDSYDLISRWAKTVI